MTGERFNRLVVLKDSKERTKSGQKKYVCLCDCGNRTIVSTGSLKNETTKSCGCYQKELQAKEGRKKFYKHGLSNHPLYPTWTAMKSRCYNKNNISYKNYGARGIKVCDKWLNSFENFLKDMGEKPSNKHSLDRIDIDGDYEPSNCKWSTHVEQAINKRAITKYRNIHKRKDTGRFDVIIKRNNYSRYKRVDTLQEAIELRDKWLREYDDNPTNW